MDRRHLLAAGVLAATGSVVASTHGASADAPDPLPGHLKHRAPGPATAAADPGVTPYTVGMPIPGQLRPARVYADHDYYEHTMEPADVRILPGVKTAALTFGGSFIAPTIRARAGRTVRIKYTNRLSEPANVHLHGGHVAADHDGHPMDTVPPGASRVYEYQNRQDPAMLWYHDHTHHREAEHVYRGMHGFYLIESDAEKRLNLPSGKYDVPMMIRDAAFDENGQLIFDDAVDPLQTRLTTMVNGKVQPYFAVAARRYRFRLLNTSNHRTFHLTFGDLPVVQVGSDGGLLPRPVPVTELSLSPAERADVVVDFGGRATGSRILLETAELGPILRFDVDRQSADTSAVPAVLRTMPAPPVPIREREITLGLSPDQQWFWIDGKPYDPYRIDATVRRGTTEVWKVHNADTVFGGIEHVFHMHLVQFRVLDRDGAPPLPGETGFKDTVHIPGGTTVRLLAKFTDFTGVYAYHCHMMEHASTFQMMAQMEVVP
ncbi:multicopper oxidase family protein [Actinoplanes sp. NPDC023714]|uniref:multicopper oxidase family protein n=1 Tax=Actinoplanes sp. NPDC023714 TaxID=3154322 RepID=UPI0033C3FD01